MIFHTLFIMNLGKVSVKTHLLFNVFITYFMHFVMENMCVTRAPRVGALYARRISKSINKCWKLYLSLFSAFICSSTDCDQSSYQVQWLSLKLFKILSGYSFCIKCYCDFDIWPSDVKIYRGHLLTMTNFLIKKNDCHS